MSRDRVSVRQRDHAVEGAMLALGLGLGLGLGIGQPPLQLPSEGIGAARHAQQHLGEIQGDIGEIYTRYRRDIGEI